MIRLLIFEDNVKYLTALRFVLDDAEDIEIVATYPDASQVCERVNQHAPDIILMDIEMPGLDGIQSLVLLRKENKAVIVIMLSVLKEKSQIFAAIQAGANGYLVKSWPGESILEEIRYIYETGKPVMSPEIAQNLFEMAQAQFPTDENFSPKHFALSKQEKLVLEQLVNGKTYPEIAAELYISQHTVNSHLKNVYKKLDVHSSVGAIRIAIQNKLFE
jgi:DNA-binding NarL/FixJ family response regulator